jgi:endonuclease-8
MIDKLKSLGPDMLVEDISDQKFIEIFRKRPTWDITKALMDQSIIAGVGNYIKADSLWMAQISPHRTIADLSDGELAQLNRSIKQVMKESYSNGNDNNYPNKFFIYGKTVDVDGNKVIKESTGDKRTTYWAPNVQK